MEVPTGAGTDGEGRAKVEGAGVEVEAGVEEGGAAESGPLALDL